MAFQERDNANDFSPPEDFRQRSSDLVSRLAQSNKPVLLSRHNKSSKSVFSKYTKDGEDAASKPSTGGWMSSSGMGTRLGLAEAFQRTDVNGNFIPRQRPSARERPVGVTSDSRIPRSRTFSPPAKDLSPPRNYNVGYNLGGRNERAVSMPVDSESDTGTRNGSPSPAPRERRPRSRDGSGNDVSPKISPVDRYSDDYFEKVRFQEEKDNARMKRIMASTTPVFIKGRVGPKVEETTRTLARKTSESSLEAEPPIRPPRSWGSKSKRTDGWMRKILSPDTSLELKDGPEDQASLERQRAGPDVPLPSVEDLPSIQNPTPPASRPASAQPINDSPGKSQMWNADLDFTAQSLQMSTSPQLRVRNMKLDDIRDREIQTLTARAVATNRLEEIRERNSEDRSTNLETVSPESQDRGRTEKRTPDLQEKDGYGEMTILEEEGDHIPNTPITIFTAAAYERLENSHSRSASESRERTSSSSREGNAGRSNHARDDSRELLRRLSRATSNSPASTISTEKALDNLAKTVTRERSARKTEEKPKKAETAPVKSEKPTEKDKEASVKVETIITKSEKPVEKRSEHSHRRSALDLDAKRHSGASTPPKSDVDPEERITAEARLFELQDNKSERNSVKGQSRSPSPEDGQFDETPKPRHKVDPLSLPTPRVTGAYIETPAPRKISSQRELATRIKDPSIVDVPQSTKQLLPSNISRPPLINTARRASIVEDLRQLQQEIGIEDPTLEDFDAVLEADAVADSRNHTTILEPVLDLEYDERTGLPLSKKAMERKIERIQLDRMSQSIKNTSSSIRDARQGIERLEEQVSSSIPHISKGADETRYINIKIPVPRLWTTLPPVNPSMKASWKLTWSGLILAIFLGWYISETAMCAQFCHPVDSRVNTWQPSDPFFPWAIPTKLDQWTGEIVSSTLGLNFPHKMRHYRPPYGSNDWWEGRGRPAGIKRDVERSIFMDEMV